MQIHTIKNTTYINRASSYWNTYANYTGSLIMTNYMCGF